VEAASLPVTEEKTMDTFENAVIQWKAEIVAGTPNVVHQK
jgi:hypothetical protein